MIYEKTDTNQQINAIAILKIENDYPHNIPGKVLKICTFKVAENASGNKLGELLLMAIFQYAANKKVSSSQKIDYIYTEVLSKHEDLIAFLEQFGFSTQSTDKPDNSQICVKSLIPPKDENLSSLEYHIAYGPPALKVNTVFIVPIIPRWTDALFPESRIQQQLLSNIPAGNAIRKAYLCNSKIKSIPKGATLLFYRSQKNRSVIVIGVVESILRSADPHEIRKFVGSRTVYTDAEIHELCENGKEVLAILFREDRLLKDIWSLEDLIKSAVIKRAPQSIHEIKEERGLKWIKSKLSDTH